VKSAILIGASGFLGQHMMGALRAEGYEVHAVVHRSNPAQAGDALIHGGIKAVDHKLVDRIKPELIIHCARPSYPRLRRLGRSISAYLASRLNQNLLTQLQKTSCRPLLVFSSGSLVYGNSGSPHEEKLTANPVSYARQYYRGEKPFTRAVRDASYPVLLFRLPWLLGKGSWFKWFYLDPLLKKQSIPVFQSGENIMEIIDVRDAVKLMLQFAGDGKNGVVNIPGSARISQQSFADKVSEISGASQKQYNEVFDGKMEKEAVDAFTSNILLNSSHQEDLEKIDYIPLGDSLREIISAAE
jgi:nucleoside-diphosphate-sugar epimerase